MWQYRMTFVRLPFAMFSKHSMNPLCTIEHACCTPVDTFCSAVLECWLLYEQNRPWYKSANFKLNRIRRERKVHFWDAIRVSTKKRFIFSLNVSLATLILNSKAFRSKNALLPHLSTVHRTANYFVDLTAFSAPEESVWNFHIEYLEWKFHTSCFCAEQAVRLTNYFTMWCTVNWIIAVWAPARHRRSLYGIYNLNI